MSTDTQGPLREYVGIIWIAENPGERFTILAPSLDAAETEMIRIYGPGHAYTLYNEDDAKKPR